MNISTRKGFTLIELLVVIAIIALLSSVVFGQLTQHRNKSNDAAIKRELTSFRNATELIKDSAGTYSSACTDGTEPNKIYKSILNKGLENPVSNNICLSGNTFKFSTDPSSSFVSGADPNKWAVSVRLKSVDNGWICMDYRGVVVQLTSRRIDNSPIQYNCN
jgi:prepilin-type N-terminal cleavage/methylation domain-containing protein